MNSKLDHNKILKKLAKERLEPYKIFQKGQSRTFLYDHGWYTIIIEFQPSSWSKGTYLNIGVDINFYPRDYFAFSYGYRESKFGEFNDEAKFITFINELCDLIIERVQELNINYKDLQTAKNTINNTYKIDGWRLFDLAILNGLTKDIETAKQLLNQLISATCERDWEFERQQFSNEILKWIILEENFTENIISLIGKTREMKKLPLIELNNLT